MIIEIEDKLVSSELFTKDFVCNLQACKGACCLEGDTGAPLERKEITLIEKNLDKITPFMTSEGIGVVNQQGVFYHDPFGDPVTSLVEGKDCVFVFRDEQGITKCAIEKAYRDGKIDFNKPISCHLYPIRTRKLAKHESLNYDRWSICDDACKLGKELQVPVFRFLKEPIIRRYGEAFFKELEIAEEAIKNQAKEKKKSK